MLSVGNLVIVWGLQSTLRYPAHWLLFSTFVPLSDLIHKLPFQKQKASIDRNCTKPFTKNATGGWIKLMQRCILSISVIDRKWRDTRLPHYYFVSVQSPKSEHQKRLQCEKARHWRCTEFQLLKTNKDLKALYFQKYWTSGWTAQNGLKWWIWTYIIVDDQVQSTQDCETNLVQMYITFTFKSVLQPEVIIATRTVLILFLKEKMIHRIWLFTT